MLQEGARGGWSQESDRSLRSDALEWGLAIPQVPQALPDEHGRQGRTMWYSLQHSPYDAGFVTPVKQRPLCP